MTKSISSLVSPVVLFMIMLVSVESLSAQKLYQGLLWEISGRDMQRPSYLYGTMHVSNKVAFNLGDPFFNALESVDQVALELEPEDWFKEVLDGDLMSASMRYGTNAGQMGFYGTNSWNQFEGRMDYPSNINLKIQEAFRTSPRMINQLLFRFYDPTGNFEEETWLDMYIYQSARKLGKKTHGLETFQESMDYMRQAQEESSKSPQNYSQTDFQSRLDAQDEIENAYRKGDLDLLDSLSRQLNHRAFTKYILIERNKQFIRGMDSLMQVRPLFTGVGAAHLPGQEGCIEMLRALGYIVEPVGMGMRDTKRKDRLSEKVMTHRLKRFESNDGRVSFDVPGEAYELVFEPRAASYFSMDIPNGLTYVVDIAATGNAFQDKSTDYLLASLDSMLFEIIPGDILSQKRVMISGYPGYDIRHKVARGDVNRTMILFSEQEVVTARLAGSGEKVNKGAGDHYFSSLTLDLDKNSTVDWLTVEGPYQSFSVSMKGKIIDYTRHRPNVNGGDLMLQSVDQEKDIYQLHRLEDIAHGYIDDEGYILDKVSKAFAKDYECEEEQRKYLTRGKKKNLDVIYSGKKDRKIYGRYIKNGNQVYALHCHSASPEKAARFLDSFRLAAPSYPEVHEQVDSTLYYSSIIPWEKEDNYFERMLNMSQTPADRIETMDAYTQSSELLPPGTNDRIWLEYQRYGRYAHEADKQEYLKAEREEISGHGDLVIEQENYQWNEQGYKADFLLSDSLTDYRFAIHRVLDGTRMLSVGYGYDSHEGSSEFFANFIEALNLMEDSLSRTTLFSDSPSLLIADLQSDDTTQFEMANGYLQNSYELSEEWEYEIGKALKLKSSSLAVEADRKYYTSLYNRSRYADKSEAMMKSLEKEYRQSADSAAYQKEILSLYAQMKDVKAIDYIKELLLEDAPIGVSMLVYDSFFRSLQDSLELAARLYPDIMLLTEYTEYKDPVLETLAMLVDSNAIPISKVKKYRSYMLRQAKTEFKRFQSTGYGMTENDSYYHQNGVDIGDYWSILWPWRNRKDVSELYALAELSSKTPIKKAYALFQLDKGLSLNDDAIQGLRPKDKPLEDYAFLEKIDRLDLFPDSLDLPACFVKSIVESQFRDYAYDWDDTEIDSVSILSTRIDSIRTRAFTTYFVKSRAQVDKDEKWQLHIVMVASDSDAPYFEYIYSSDDASALRSEADQLDILHKQLIAQNRSWPYRNQRRSMDMYSY